MTDGDNNAGKYLPLEAADIARGFGMDVFAIGIGDKIARQQQEVGAGTTKVRTIGSAISCTTYVCSSSPSCVCHRVTPRSNPQLMHP